MLCELVLLALTLGTLSHDAHGGLVRRGIHTCRHDQLGHRILEACSTFIDKRQLNSKADASKYLASTHKKILNLQHKFNFDNQYKDPEVADTVGEDAYDGKNNYYDTIEETNSENIKHDGLNHPESINEKRIKESQEKIIANLKQKITEWILLHNPKPQQKLPYFEVSQADEKYNVEDIKTSPKPSSNAKASDRMRTGLKIFTDPSNQDTLEDDEDSKDGNIASLRDYNLDLPDLGDDRFLLDQFRIKVENEKRELEILENYYKLSDLNNKSKKQQQIKHKIYKRDNLENIPKFKYINPNHGISKRDNEAMNRLLSKCCHMGCRDNDFAFLCHNR